MKNKKDLLQSDFESKLDSVDLKAIYGGTGNDEITEKKESTHNKITDTYETDWVPDQASAGGGSST